MTPKQLIQEARRLSRPYRFDGRRRFRIGDVDPADTGGLGNGQKKLAREALEHGVRMLADLQERLYADDRWAVLLIFQAMDAAGKDGAIKHVMSGVNPQGCQVHSFKSPSPEELDHDFLWRCVRRLPERGRIGIFNRSYYEETLIVRVHPELLAHQKLPRNRVTSRIWTERFEDIRAFEQHLDRSGVLVRKFFLHVSKDEQRRRFLSRLEDPDKHWKFSGADLREREYWDEYQHAYEETIRRTASREAPWYVVPADHKWYTRLIVAAAVIEALASLDLRFPEVDPGALKELAAARAHLGGR